MLSMSYQLFGVSVAFLAQVIPTTVSEPTIVQDGPKAAYFLGAVEGKSFFVDNPTTFLNWTEAKDFCAQSNLRLASLTSLVQEDFIFNAMKDIPAYDFSWTAGRDSKRLSQFAWDHAPDSNLSTSKMYTWLISEYQNCLAVRTGPYGFEYQAYPCSHALGVLCETIS